MRDRFLKPKIKEIKKNLYEIENKKIFLNQKQKRLEKVFLN